MLINCIRRILLLGYSERMSIRVRMIILPLYTVLHYCLTKTYDLTFIRYHNFLLQSSLMVVTTSVRAQSWHEDVRACELTRFVPYPLHKSKTYVVIFLFVVMAYFRPYVVPCLILGIFQRTTCEFIFLFPSSPRCRENCFVPFSIVSTLYLVLSPSVPTLDLILSPYVSVLEYISS